MNYKDEWLVIEANDDIDETEHREPSEELLFYRAVANGEVDAVRKNCEQDRFMDTDGVGVLSKDPVTNLIPFCGHHGHGDPDVQAVRHGAGTGLPDE